jgi:hypothetical protein
LNGRAFTVARIATALVHKLVDWDSINKPLAVHCVPWPNPMPPPSDKNAKTSGVPSSEKAVKTRCPHCQSINQIVGAIDDAVFECTHCEKQFRLRKKVNHPPVPPAPVIVPDVKRFPIRCTCQAKLSVTYSDFGKRVKCKSCNQMIKIPDWVAESKFSDDEFDDMLSAEERDAFQATMAHGRMKSR